MTRRTLRVSALIVAAVLVACAVALLVAISEKAEATVPGKNGRIAFDAYTPERGSPSQIFTINPNGSGEKRLTHSSSIGNYSPSYSPDGKKIAFLNELEGRHIADPLNIWTVGAHGKNPTYLTHPSAAGRVELRPDWGPRPTG